MNNGGQARFYYGKIFLSPGSRCGCVGGLVRPLRQGGVSPVGLPGLDQLGLAERGRACLQGDSFRTVGCFGGWVY